MRATLATVALALTLVVPGAAWVQAQDSDGDSAAAGKDADQVNPNGDTDQPNPSGDIGQPNPDGDADQGSTTGSMTTTPGDTGDDAPGTNGETMRDPDPAAPAAGCEPGAAGDKDQPC